jgi:hypothetical protein
VENHPPYYPVHWWKIIHLLTLHTGGESSTFFPAQWWKIIHLLTLQVSKKSSTFLPCTLVENHPPYYPEQW